MAWTGAAMAAVTLGSAIMGADAQRKAGAAAKDAGLAQQQADEYQASELRTEAGQSRASSQLSAEDQRRKENLVLSRARAVAAASGAGASDPTVSKVEGTVVREGEFSALTALYNGEERARGLETAASLKQFEGTQAAKGGAIQQDIMNVQSTATILGGVGQAGGMYYKYGPRSTGTGMTIPRGGTVGGFDQPNYGGGGVQYG